MAVPEVLFELDHLEGQRIEKAYRFEGYIILTLEGNKVAIFESWTDKEHDHSVRMSAYQHHETLYRADLIGYSDLTNLLHELVNESAWGPASALLRFLRDHSEEE